MFGVPLRRVKFKDGYSYFGPKLADPSDLTNIGISCRLEHLDRIAPTDRKSVRYTVGRIG